MCELTLITLRDVIEFGIKTGIAVGLVIAVIILIITITTKLMDSYF